MDTLTRRSLLRGTVAGAASLMVPRFARAADLGPVEREIQRRHGEAVQRLQEWIHQPTIAAEGVGGEEGVQLFLRMLRDAGFQRAEKVPTEGFPGVFATLDAGAQKTVGLYFMYDVKQVDPQEWSSPPWEGRIVDKPGFGKVLVGRGAVNQKGPEATFLAALHALRGAGRKPPVNFVLVAEGEEEIGSVHFAQVVRKPEIAAALAKTAGIFMPFAAQDPDGNVTINLGAKGVIELELIASGEKWGRGPEHDIHSSLRASVDSPAFHLVQALATMVSPDGVDPAIDGYFEKVRPLSAEEERLIEIAAQRKNEAQEKKSLGVQHWVRDVPYREALRRLAGRPTVNIEGLVGGYTGPGGKTVLPHRAVAKLDLRLVPDMTVQDTLQKLKAHLSKRGFGDIEVKVGGAYPPNTTRADSQMIRAEIATYRAWGIDPILWPRLGGSWPGYLFTEPPLNLAAGHFGLGHGSGAHAPNEYYVIESSNPKVQGIDGATLSYVQYMHTLAEQRA
jgi:acetylornithine deacetylase/succinyl-diaminopimelate desuccinylase-like protein